MSDIPVGPQIVEAYKNYSPPFDVPKTIRTLLRHVPTKCLTGLKTIVLTNREALSHDRRRRRPWSRGRKSSGKNVLGTYHQAWKGEPAWIEIFVDKVVADTPSKVGWMPVVRKTMFGEVLYHEMGHHIHRDLRPEFREHEDVADEWGRRLWRKFFQTHYLYLLPVVKLLATVRRSVGNVKSRKANRN